MHRPLLLLLCAALLGCPPVRSDDDDATDDDDDDDDDLQDSYDSLTEGACDVIPDNVSVLTEGAGQATEGLWYEVRCIWTGGNASEITINVGSFDAINGGDFPVTSLIARDAGGAEVGLEGELGNLHLLQGTSQRLNGWWEGDLSGFDVADQPVQLDAIVFRGAVVDTVVGR